MLDLPETLVDADFYRVEFLLWVGMVVVVLASSTVEMASTVLGCDID